MSMLSPSADPALLARLVTQLPPARFVETGTYHGDSVDAALPFFASIDTIEVDQQLADAARARFADYDSVTVHHGSSPNLLAGLRSDDPTVFWLTARETEDLVPAPPPCPLLDELAAIGPIGEHQVVLIDDARFFLSPRPAPRSTEGWPTLCQVLSALCAGGANHELLVIEDVIVSCPPALAGELRDFAHEHARDPHWLLTTVRPPPDTPAPAPPSPRPAVVDLSPLSGQLRSIQASQAQIGALGAQLSDVQRSLGTVNEQITSLQQAQQHAAVPPPRKQWRYPVATLKHRVNKLNRLQHYPPRPLRIPRSYGREPLPGRAPTISIVTPSLNQGRFVAQTVASVLDQAYPALEYVIQDGGSNDGTMELLEPQSNRLHHLESAPDSGQAEALNRGFAHTGGELMAYLNSDDLLLPGSLAFAARYFAEHPDVDVLYGDRIMIDRFGQEIGRWVLPPHDDTILDWVDYVPQETLFWRRTAWDAAGGKIDEGFRFAMDWDLLIRMRDAGAAIAHVPRFLGAFRIHDDQKTAAWQYSDGQPEMERIRRRIHSREPSDNEILAAIRPYLLRHVAHDQLYRWRIRRS